MTDRTRHSWKGVRDLIQSKILDTTYAPGDKMPRDQDIAAELGCARTTVQRAMRDLSDSGILERRRKGGTRVRADPLTRATLDIQITRKEVEQNGSVYSYQLLKKAMAVPPLSVFANFGLTVQSTMLRIEALHLANQRPYIYENRWVSTQTVPEIATVDLEAESANEWLVRNKPYSRCDIRFYAVKANKYYAEIFETGENEALFVIERTTWAGLEPITTVKAVTAPGYQMRTQI